MHPKRGRVIVARVDPCGSGVDTAQVICEGCVQGAVIQNIMNTSLVSISSGVTLTTVEAEELERSLL